jgi:predicted DNA-binding protein
MSRTLSIRLTADQAAWLKATSRKTGIAQGKLVREQIDRARTSVEPAFMRLAGSMTGPPDLSMRKGFSR